MFYIIQENTFKEAGYDSLIKNLDKMDLKYEIVKVFPFIDDVEFKTDRKDVFVFGGTKLARIAKEFNWKPGVLLTENHDYAVYKDHYKENLLNYDSKIVSFDEDFDWGNNEILFMRPCLDSKLFTGAVFSKEEWRDKKEKLHLNESKKIDSDTLIQVSSPKPIQAEYRFYVVGGKVVTGSQYRQGNSHYENEVVFDDGAKKFCQEMVHKFQLAEAFTMDVCLSNDEYKIVECGCINCSGFYKINMTKLLVALEEHFDNK